MQLLSPGFDQFGSSQTAHCDRCLDLLAITAFGARAREERPREMRGEGGLEYTSED
jgi:hypothetical protein